MDPSEDGTVIDIDKELDEFIKNKLITSYDVVKKESSGWDVKIISLEKYYITIRFNVSSGIQVRIFYEGERGRRDLF